MRKASRQAFGCPTLSFKCLIVILNLKRFSSNLDIPGGLRNIRLFLPEILHEADVTGEILIMTIEYSQPPISPQKRWSLFFFFSESTGSGLYLYDLGNG